MISTHSKFIYGYDVTSSSKYIDFNDGTNDYAVSIDVGSYTPNELADDIETALNSAASAVVFTVTFSPSTRYFTIAGDAQFDLLVDTGDNASNGIYTILGISTVSDFINQTSITSTTATGSVYNTQFKLQDYVSNDDNKMSRFPSVNKAASGKTTLIRFGVDEMFEFSFKYLTDRPQSSASPIVSNVNGLSNFRSLMQHLTQKKPVEFYPNKDDNSTYHRVILESSAESSDGTGYKLNEQFSRGLIGYFDTGVMKFRKVN